LRSGGVGITVRGGGVMKYIHEMIEITLGGMTYVPSFINIGIYIQNLGEGGINIRTHTEVKLSHKPTFIFKNKENRFKIVF
jgi:hypothetical protein